MLVELKKHLREMQNYKPQGDSTSYILDWQKLQTPTIPKYCQRCGTLEFLITDNENINFYNLLYCKSEDV